MRLLVYTPTYGGRMRRECRMALMGQRTDHDWV